MRLLLIISIAAAVAAVGAVAYQFRPRGAQNSESSRSQTMAAAPAPAPSPVRSIPIRPRDPVDPAPVPPETAREKKTSDVLADVSTTLEDLRKQEPAKQEGAGSGGLAITPSQVDALKAQAERRHVRPVTRMSFPLEPGTTVPPQVFLHPMPPELAGLGSTGDPLGFIQVGERFVLVGTVSRRIVAIAKG